MFLFSNKNTVSLLQKDSASKSHDDSTLKNQKDANVRNQKDQGMNIINFEELTDRDLDEMVKKVAVC